MLYLVSGRTKSEMAPSASVDNTLLDLQNSSYPTKPHSIIANYTMLCKYGKLTRDFWAFFLV